MYNMSALKINSAQCGYGTKKNYPVTNNEWGEFQSHRKVLGLVCVANCTEETQFSKILNKYEEIKRIYRSSLYDSRLIVFGFHEDGTFVSPIVKESTVHKTGENVKETGIEVDSPVNHDDNSIEIIENSEINSSKKIDESNDSNNTNNALGDDLLPDSVENENGEVNDLHKSRSDSSLSRENARTQVLFYPTEADCTDLENKMKEFALSLFWVLESKRLDRAYEKLDRPPLLMTPLERREYNISESEWNSRTYRKKCLGRLRKHQGDLSLQAGVPAEAALHYQTAIDNLKSTSDWLWLAGAYEGLCSTSVIVMYPKVERSNFNRNLSFSVKRGKSAMHEARLVTGSYNSSGPNGFEIATTKVKNCLPADDIIDKYKEAIIQYSKYRYAGIIELEASIKACRVLILQHKYLAASEFLQNVVYINLQLSDEEKIQRYTTLALLYSDIGFHRKAAFFRRIAALQCVSAQSAEPGWNRCYNLLVQTLEGYKISLDPREFYLGNERQRCGWPVIQLRLLHELVYSARRHGQPELAVRHMTFLLQTMFEYLPPFERSEISKVLETYTEKVDVKSQPIVAENGIIVPTVPLTKIPIITSFKPLPLPGHLQPTQIPSKILKAQENHGVFIYSPINFGTQNSRPKSETKDETKLDFKWMKDYPGQVELKVYNPMPTELRVENMTLLTEDLEFHCNLESFVLPPESGPHKVLITGIPKEPGQLTMTGYHSEVFGVPSNCRLRDIINNVSNKISTRKITELKHSRYAIDIVPALPSIQLSTKEAPPDTRLNIVTDHTVTSAMLHLYVGQSHESVVMITNIGEYAIEHIELKLDSKQPKELSGQMFHWNVDNLQAQLPLQPGRQASFTLYVTAVDDVVSYDAVILEEAENIPSLLSPRPRTLHVRTFDTSRPTSPVPVRRDTQFKKTFEALLTFLYSGGPGREEGYCRQCSLALKIEMLPSLYFKKWSVIPDKSPNSCEMCLEVINATTWDMDIVSTSGKTANIASKQSSSFNIFLPRDLLPTEESPDWPSYSQQIANYLDVRWKLPSLDVEGKAFVEKLEWTPAQLDLMRSSPLDWTVRLNGEAWQHDGINSTFGLGETIELDISITNCGDYTQDEITLHIMCQESKAGGEAEHEGLVSIIGNTKAKFYKVIAEEAFNHSCSCIFYCAGLYSFQLSCAVISEPEKKQHVWRYSPDVEVNII